MRQFLIAVVLLLSTSAGDGSAQISEETQECIDCHESYTPGIIADWHSSKHSLITPAEALAMPELERRISSKEIPESLRQVTVGCYECHSLNKADHPDNFEHFDFWINTIVSPNDCRVCHEIEAEQYAGSKKSEAVRNLADNQVFSGLVSTITSTMSIDRDLTAHGKSTNVVRNETCYACHGTEVKVVGMRTIETELGEIEVPDLANWPNQGVGRINPDGSYGACTACHPRHSFSIEIARKPYTCAQCHLEPDVPAYQVYMESKHGNIFESKLSNFDWEHVPWTIGTDFTAPTCATCHSSLIVNTDGDVVLPRTHDFGSRLWVRIFGLIYSHPQPKSGATYRIVNSDGLPMPTTFSGELASDYLIDRNEQNLRQSNMKKLCRNCHGPTWVDGFFARFEASGAEADSMVSAATQILEKAWDDNLADRTNPFDEPLEQKWVRQWLFYANSVRYSSAMSGPDYAAFKNGWWSLNENLQSMLDYAHRGSGNE